MILGPLDDVVGSYIRPQGLTISPFVFHWPGGERLRLAPGEVDEAFWTPLSFLAEPANVRPYFYPPDPRRRPFPAFYFKGRTIWGLTYRIIAGFMRLHGVELPKK
jgi:hypothetical protein